MLIGVDGVFFTIPPLKPLTGTVLPHFYGLWRSKEGFYVMILERLDKLRCSKDDPEPCHDLKHIPPCYRLALLAFHLLVFLSTSTKQILSPLTERKRSSRSAKILAELGVCHHYGLDGGSWDLHGEIWFSSVDPQLSEPYGCRLSAPRAIVSIDNMASHYPTRTKEIVSPFFCLSRYCFHPDTSYDVS